MSTEILKSEENKEFDCIALSDQKQTGESIKNDISEDEYRSVVNDYETYNSNEVFEL